MSATSAILAAGVVLLVLRQNKGAGRGRSTLAASHAVLDEAVPVNGSDFQGDWWARLHGADLAVATQANMGGSLSADPGRIGLSQLLAGRPQLVRWNGDLNTLA